MAELITVPSFVFFTEYEVPIQVNFYSGQVELVQGNDTILINNEEINTLFKEIKKHRPKADEILANLN